VSEPLPFLDTNILLYACSVDDRAAKAQELVSEPFVTSVQALNEFAAAARRKLRQEWTLIRSILEDIRSLARRIVVIDVDIHISAIDLAQGYKLSFYDACMLAAALRANCSIFYSEDMHHGLVVDRRLTITNPFQ
jgi:predicted nucleic acid-binding protein